MPNFVLRHRALPIVQICTLLLLRGRGLIGMVMALMLAALHGHAYAANDAAPSGTQTVAAAMTAGETYSIVIPMKNTGSVAWTVAGNYNLVLQSPSGWNLSSISVGGTIGLNVVKSFTASMIAPSTPGTYNFQWCMQAAGVQFGTCSALVQINVAAPAPNAQFVSQTALSKMTATAQGFSITMKNTGNTTWKVGQVVMVPDSSNWGITQTPLQANVAPGGNGIFNSTIKAPAPGAYTMQWQMQGNGATNIGAPTPVLNVAVAGAAPSVSISKPTAGQTYIANAGYMNVPIYAVATPTGVATITAVSVYYNDGTQLVQVGTQNGPVFDQTLRLLAGIRTLYINAVDSFSKVTQTTVNITGLTDGSQLVSHTIPTAMVPGLQYNATITLKNSGTTTWDPQEVTLAPYSAGHITNWGDFSIPLSTPVPPGGTATFATTLTAPQTEGTLVFQMQLHESARSAFGAIVSVNVAVAHPVPVVTLTAPAANASIDVPAGAPAMVRIQGSATPGTGATIDKFEVLDVNTVIATVYNSAAMDQTLPLAPGAHQLHLRATDNFGKVTMTAASVFTVKSNDAKFSTQSVVTLMQAGKAYNTSVTMTNSGSKPWTAAAGYALVSDNPSAWGITRIAPTTTVNPGASYTFAIPVTAPAAPGLYAYQWHMVQDGVETFGDVSTIQKVIVNPPPPTVLGLSAPVTGATAIAIGGKASVRVQGSATPGAGATITQMLVVEGSASVARQDNSPSLDQVALLTPGTHTLKLTAFDNFGQSTTSTAATTITVLTNNAAPFSGIATPAMVAGNTYQVSITVKNTGTSTWTAADGYAFSSVIGAPAWIQSPVPVTGSIAPNTNATFVFNVTAPLDPGTYQMQWQMVQQGRELFGTATPVENISVTGVPPTVSLSGPASGSSYVAANGSAQVPVAGSASAVNSGTIAKFEVLDGATVVYTGSGTPLNALVPLAAGSHSLQLRATDNHGNVGLSQKTTVTVQHNDAVLVSKSVPASMNAGQRYTLSFTVKNTGDTTWQPVSGSTGLGIALAEQPNNGGLWLPSGRVQLANAVAPGQSYTFTFDVIAPATPNSYLFQWRMSDESKELFGALLADLQMPVTPAPVPVATMLSASPANQRVAPGQSGGIEVDGLASETGGLLVKLELFADNGSGYGPAVYTQSGGAPTPVGMMKTVISLPSGSYRVKLRATDDGGRYGDSAPMTVNVTDSPLLGQVTGVRTSGAQGVQLVGWACRDMSSEALNYQVFVNAPPALGGALIASGAANVGSEVEDAAVQQLCHSPGASHHFVVDLASLQSQYPGAPLFVSASSTHGESIVLPCNDHSCTMPNGMRIGLSSPNVNNLDRFQLPIPAFARAVVTGFTGNLDEVSFNINGEWLPATAEGGGAYSVSKTGLQPSAAPYAAYAKVRQGDVTLITEEHLFYVDPGVVPGAVSPTSGSVVPLSQATVLSTVVNATVQPGQSVKFFIDPKTAQLKTAQAMRSMLAVGPIGAALVGVPVNLASASASSSVVGDATFDGVKWNYVWKPAQEGSYTVVARMLDADGFVMMETPPITLTVSASANPSDPTPKPVVVTPPPELANLIGGTLPGSLTVSPRGAAAYSMPLVVPPGSAGLQPELALAYDGDGPNGAYGLGWSLQGTSAIYRCGKTIAQDGVNTRISFTNSDRLCLDGKRLVLTTVPVTDDTYWADGAQYRTEVDSFSRISAQGSGAQRSFKVEMKNGRVATYGTYGSSAYAQPIVQPVQQGDPGLGAAASVTPQAKSGAQFWAIEQVRDRSGNFINYAYEQDTTSGEHRLRWIRYGGNGLNSHAAVELTYVSRQDAWKRYIDETRNDLRSLVSHIKTYAGTNLDNGADASALVRDYALSYELSPTSGRSLLNSVKACGRNPVSSLMDCLPETSFTWGKPDPKKTPGFESKGIWAGAPILTTWNPANHVGANHSDYFAFQDFENHGYTDVLEKRIASAGTTAGDGIADGDSAAPGTMAKSYRYFHNNGKGFTQYTYRLNTRENFVVLNVADFNGDGAPDLLVAADSGAQICLSPLASADALAGEEIVFTCQPNLGAAGANIVRKLPYAVDVVGDGRSAIYGALNPLTMAATFCLQQDCVTDNDPPVTVLSYSNTDLGTPDVTTQRYVSFDQMVDFTGSGKPADVRWSQPFFLDQIVKQEGQTGHVQEWLNLTPQVVVTTFHRPGSVAGNDAIAPYQYRAYFDPAVTTQWPYDFDQPHPDSNISADFNGSGYQGLAFGFLEFGYDPVTGYRLYNKAQTTLCLSTGRALDCGVRQLFSGANYQAIRAVDNFVGDGMPGILVETLSYPSNQPPVRTGQLQMCRVTGDDTSTSSASDSNMHCQPWPGVSLPRPIAPLVLADQAYFMDLLGTGRKQLVLYHSASVDANRNYNEDGRWEVFAPVDVAFDGQALDRIAQVKDGLGAVSQVEYADGLPAGVVTQSPLTTAYPQHLSASARKVVSRLSLANGVGVPLSTTYQYNNEILDVSGRGSQGFAQVTALNEQNGILTTMHYAQQWPFTGMLTAMQRSRDGVLLTDVANTLDQQPSATATVFPYVKDVVEQRRDLSGDSLGTIHTVNGYSTDGLGNLEHVTVTSTGADGQAFVRQVDTEYDNHPDAWLFGVPSKVTETRTDPVSGTLARHMAYTYVPGTLLPDTQTIEPGRPQYEVLTSFERSGNAFGLVSARKQSWLDPATQSTARRTVEQIAYDNFGRFPVTVSNAVSQVTSSSFEPGTGARITLQDVNNLIKKWEVDGFGRVTRELHADGNEIQTAVKDCQQTCPLGAAVAQVREYYHGSDRIAAPEVVYSDAVGRVLRSQTVGFDGAPVVTDQHYDGQGRLGWVERPRLLSATAFMERSYSYDGLDRVVASYTNDEMGTLQMAKTDYNGLRRTLTNAKGQQRVEVSDVLGQLRQVSDALNKTTSFEYEPFGGLSKTTDSGGNAIVVSYDDWGRKLILNDPDLGILNYSVDPVGRTYEQSNPEQRKMTTGPKKTTMLFDALDRMTARLEPELKSYWVYDTATNGVGKLAEAYTGTVDAKDYQRLHSYDSLGHPAEIAQKLSDGWYYARTDYDAWSRLLRQRYQRGTDPEKAFERRYNNFGYLYQYLRGAMVLREVQQQNPDGEVALYGFGNGLSQVRAYNPYTALLGDARVVTVAGSEKVVEAYQYDVLGNLSHRNQYWDQPGFQEDLHYDELNRLRFSQVLGQAQLEFTYDDLGNLTSKPGVGAYTYLKPGPGVVGPHAVQSSSMLGSYSYDGNGNMTSGGGRSITWTTFDMPQQIVQAEGSATFIYGSEHQRVRQERGDRSTVIYAGAQEVELKDDVPTVKTYWPDGIGVEIDRPSGTTDLRWMHTDRLGSVIALTDESGNLIDRLSYDVWGVRRNQDGSAAASKPTGMTDDRGFTGQEMLDQLSLVHMNGRVYDPLLAKFLSGDPLVQDPTNGQNYNRYSYVLNNPTNFTDPTGFACAGDSRGDECTTKVQTTTPTGSNISCSGDRCGVMASLLNLAGFSFQQASSKAKNPDPNGKPVDNGTKDYAGQLFPNVPTAVAPAGTVNSSNIQSVIVSAPRPDICQLICVNQTTGVAYPNIYQTGNFIQDHLRNYYSQTAAPVWNAGHQFFKTWSSASMLGMGAAAEVGGANLVEEALFTEISFGQKATRYSAGQINVGLTQAQAIENLAANGFSKALSKDGTVTIMTSGDKVYRFYPASTGGGVAGASSGVPSASVSIMNKIVSKLRFWGN